MAYTSINKPTDYFNTKLYTGTGSQLAVTGVGFQPDWIWFKNRGTTNSHGLQDVVRGFNTTGIQSTNGSDADPAFNGSTLGYVSAVGSDGFTVEAGGCANASGNNYVAWNWLADNTSGSSNTDGSITSTVSANTTSGFSIVSYLGNSNASKTIGHGLGTAPSMIITKDRDNTRNWCVYHKSLGATKFLRLNLTNASATSTGRWNDTEPTSSVFTVGDDAETGNAFNYVAYCFAEKKGFSKFGSYTGNGSADGPMVYTGFKPAWIMIKNTNVSNNWVMHDNKRKTFNPNGTYFYPNSNSAEVNYDPYSIDLLSNGFKTRNNNDQWNSSGNTFIYMAFAESPFTTSTGVPTTAR